MATYKRQLWTSGYIYRQQCPHCATVVEYTDRQLGYRSWYPNGFVYCTRCRKPIRHNEFFALRSDGTRVYATQAEADLAVREGYFSVVGAPAPAPGVITPNPAVYPNAQGYTASPGYAPAPGYSPAPSSAPASFAPSSPATDSVPNAESLAGTEAPQNAACSNCGREYVPGRDHFCPSCGNKLD